MLFDESLKQVIQRSGAGIFVEMAPIYFIHHILKNPAGPGQGHARVDIRELESQPDFLTELEKLA